MQTGCGWNCRAWRERSRATRYFSFASETPYIVESMCCSRPWCRNHFVSVKDTARHFDCASCGRQVVLCRRCDRGHVYCSRSCGEAARRRSLRLAGQRYQNSRRGRHKHAQRQRRYRERLGHRASENCRLAQKVTHHRLTGEHRRPFVRKTPDGRPGTRPSGQERPTGILRCDGCGRFCGRVAIGICQEVRCRRSRLPKRASKC